MDTFRRLFIVAALAGLISGGLITVVHQVSTSQIILAAEVFEDGAETTEPSSAQSAAGATVTSPELEEHNVQAHEHDGEAWGPEDGAERILYTALADILTGIGFSLLLVAAYRIWGGQINWRVGLYWGFAGFAAIVLSPNLGLPPEVPGTEAAALADRQIWWIATAVLTAIGLGLIILGKHVLLAALGLALIVLPHAYGAPQPTEYVSLAPRALEHRFIIAATITGLLFWSAMGAMTGYFYNRFVKQTAS